MTFTGTLIEDLMATVERAEYRSEQRSNVAVFTQSIAVEPMVVESWFASMQQHTEYDSKLLGVA
ncbi:MAG: hypothetical protein WAK29_23485 [Terriglobales bacterium]